MGWIMRPLATSFCDCEDFPPVQKYILDFFRGVINRQTWEDSGSMSERRLRSEVLSLACDLGHAPCLRQANQSFSDWLHSKGTLRSAAVMLERLNIHQYLTPLVLKGLTSRAAFPGIGLTAAPLQYVLRSRLSYKTTPTRTLALIWCVCTLLVSPRGPQPTHGPDRDHIFSRGPGGPRLGGPSPHIYRLSVGDAKTQDPVSHDQQQRHKQAEQVPSLPFHLTVAYSAIMWRKSCTAWQFSCISKLYFF